MSPSENEEESIASNRYNHQDPLCLFYLPDPETSHVPYLPTTSGTSSKIQNLATAQAKSSWKFKRQQNVRAVSSDDETSGQKIANTRSKDGRLKLGSREVSSKRHQGTSEEVRNQHYFLKNSVEETIHGTILGSYGIPKERPPTNARNMFYGQKLEKDNSADKFFRSESIQEFPKDSSYRSVRLEQLEQTLCQPVLNRQDSRQQPRLKMQADSSRGLNIRRQRDRQRRGKCRRFGRETHPHLTSHLISTVQAINASAPVASLTNVLETITDAWPSSKNIEIERMETKQMDSKIVPFHHLERRRSVPEEVIRKYSVSHEKTSESENNATMPEITPPSAKTKSEEAKPKPSGRKKVLERSFRLVEDPELIHSDEEGSSDSDSDAPGMERFNTIKRAPLRRESVVTSSIERASQSHFNREGQGIIKISAKEKSSQTGDLPALSDTTPSAREESESAETSETISSPRKCTLPVSSSENQSSDSEEIHCTCADIVSSKGTSTDPNHSGKSTLSQTVSENTTSTQDSTVSVNSVSSRGSTITAATDSSSTEVDPRTSAKETTDNDRTPRSPQDSRGNQTSGNRKPPRSCPHHGDNNSYKHDKRDQSDSRYRSRKYSSSPAQDGMIKLTNSCLVQTSPVPLPPLFEWSQLSQDEISLIQEERRRKLLGSKEQLPSLRSDRNLSSFTTDTNEITSQSSCYCGSDLIGGGPAMVPRYSAMPRTMSMMVNASSFEANNYSDSDCQSLADSLEDGENRAEGRTFYDTKQELKPVRGDFHPDKKVQRKHGPQGKAYFFSMDDEGVADLETSIRKIPELPVELKNKIQERHDTLHKIHEDRREKEAKEAPQDREKRHRAVKKKYRLRKLTKVNDKSTDESTTPSTVRLNEKKYKKTKPKTIERERIDTKKEIKMVNTNKETPRFVSKIPTPIPPPFLCTSREKPSKSENIDPSKKEQTGSDEKNEPYIKESQTSLDIDALTKHRLSLISSLEATALMLKAQTADLPVPKPQSNRTGPGKRPLKFRQKFEVIPEERSSSLSSAEDRLSEKNRRRSLPVKLSEASKNTAGFANEGDDKSFRRYSLGSLSSYVIAKLMGKPLQAIPCPENQQIIIFSPKEPGQNNSAKGRDALLAMDRQDFERLSKGWMNFYLLKEGSESEGEEHKNKIVCRMPSMEKDPSTTTSGTDTSQSSQQLAKSYSLTLKNADNNLFQLEECPSRPVHTHEIHDPAAINKLENNLNEFESPSKGKAEKNLFEETPLCKTKESNIQKSMGRDKELRERSTDVRESSTESWCDLPELPENTHFTEITKIERVLTKEASTSTEMLPKIRKPKATVELAAPVKLSSSNTVLLTRNIREKTPKQSGRSCSLPELAKPVESAPVKSQSLVDSLPKVPGAATESDDDSDSTVYMRAESPRLPPLSLEDCCCTSDDTSSDFDEIESSVRQPQLPLRRRPLPFRPKHRFGFYESVHGKKPGNSGWSVTVEGTIEYPRTRPDVQMRLSFPEGGGPPIVSQSDSGFVEGKSMKASRSAQQKQQWTVTVKNPQTGTASKDKHKAPAHLPNLSNASNVKPGRPSKEPAFGATQVKEKLEAVWPKIEQVIENELQSIQWTERDDCSELLSVEGRSMPIETKPVVTRRSQSTGRSSVQSIRKT